MSILVLGDKVAKDIVVGGYGRARGWSRPSYAGPMGTVWERDNVRGYFQTQRNQTLVDIEYFNAHGVRIPVYQVRSEDIRMVDRTLDLIPPQHLEWLLSYRPEGFLMDNEAGRGDSARFTGGLRPAFDDSSTTFFDESRGIKITYGASWRYRHLGIIPTMFHELGHVLTRRSRISYNYFPENRANALRGTRVSRNAGVLEALCNAYQFMICYGSLDQDIRAFGTGTSDQKDAVTREGLRGCPAFTSMLSADWIARFAER